MCMFYSPPNTDLHDSIINPLAFSLVNYKYHFSTYFPLVPSGNNMYVQNVITVTNLHLQQIMK